MKLEKDEKIFFGCKVDSKLREALALARPGDRKYFEGDGSEFLQICTAGDERWIGKVMKAGVNASEIEDIQRNIASILRRISPNIRTTASSIKIFVAQPSDPVVAEEAPPAGGGDGPYIDY